MMGLLTTIFCFSNVAIALAGGALSLWTVRSVMAPSRTAETATPIKRLARSV